jgi:elongation factor Ts
VSITASEVKTLRDRTGAGMMECKRALQEADGDMEKAVEALRVGVLVEVDCETDFVARNDDFIAFARDIALHVAAAAPLAVTDEEIPAEDREREQRIAVEQADASGKPENVVQKIVEGKLRKWLEEVVLLRQKHVNEDKYDSRTIEELRAEISAKTGENVVIRRFQRFAVGE